MDRVEQMKRIQGEALALFTKKNADYGDAFAKYGFIGVLMARHILCSTRRAENLFSHIRCPYSLKTNMFRR
jgi:hypothetical protein